MGRPEMAGIRHHTMGLLGSVLSDSGRPEEALPVFEAALALTLRYGSQGENPILFLQHNLASCLDILKRHDEALVIRREVYARRQVVNGVSHEQTIGSGCNVACSLMDLGRWDESRTLLRDQLLPAARRSLGSDHDFTLNIVSNIAEVLRDNPERTRNDLLEAVTLMEDAAQRRRRVFGPAHPRTRSSERDLSDLRERLARA